MRRGIYKVLAIMLVLLVVLNTSAIGVLADSNEGAVTPKAEDYEFSNGAITGLKADYLNGLTAEQKQNIRLVIPEKIEGVAVTAIGNGAFEVFYGALASKRYDGCSFVSLDLSKARYLETIGSDAFYDCKITGSLTFPDTLTTIGDNAFRQTKGFEGISGTLEFPENIESIGKVAFSYQQRLKKIDLSKCTKLRTLPESVFRFSGMEGVVILPESLQKIGENCFANTKISTIYLPKRKDDANEAFIASSSFASNDALKDIICTDVNDYNFVAKTVTSSNRNVVTFPVKVTFYKQNVDPLEKHSAIERLYNKPYNYIMNEDKSWGVDETYKFPLILNEDKSEKIWVSARAAWQPIKEDNKVQSYSLYSIKKVAEDPTIVYGPDVDQEYNGQSPILTVDTSHPLKKSTSAAESGDVIFYYSWNWSTINSSPAAQTGYNDGKSRYSIGADVRAPYAIVCYVTVKAYIMTGLNDEGNKMIKQFYEDSHQFVVDLRPAVPMLNPVPASGIFQMTEGQTALPEIKLSDGDTPGTITWDADQTLHEGVGSYRWTFVPEKGDNYKTNNGKIKGSTELYCTTEEFNSDLVQNKISQLGDILESGQATEDKQKEILDTFAAYDLADGDIQSQISDEQKKNLYAAIGRLPQIQTGAEGLNLGNEMDLLQNLTAKEAVAAKDSDKSISIKVVSKETQPDTSIEEIIDQTAGGDATVCIHLDVKVVKTVSTNGSSSSEEILTHVNKPLKLVFDVPEELQSANRNFFIIHAHIGADGKTAAEKLSDMDVNPATITVESDKFSTYAIAYSEGLAPDISNPSTGTLHYNITASAGEHGSIFPEGQTSAGYGKEQTFTFLPDEGYRVGDILVDGVSIGSAKSYTFTNVTAAHTIRVVFEKKPDDIERIKAGVRDTSIRLTSKSQRGSIKLTWKKSAGFKVNYYQVFRSTKKNSGYGTKAFFTTKSGTQESYKNTKQLKKGVRYYYKVRGVRAVDGKNVYTRYSNKACRIAK